MAPYFEFDGAENAKVAGDVLVINGRRGKKIGIYNDVAKNILVGHIGKRITAIKADETGNVDHPEFIKDGSNNTLAEVWNIQE